MRESPCSEIDFDQMTMTKMTTFNSSFTVAYFFCRSPIRVSTKSVAENCLA